VVESGMGEQSVDVAGDRYDNSTGRLTVNGRSFRVVTGTHGPIHLVEVDGVTHRISRDEGGVVRSPAPALVVATPVAAGAEVEAGAPVLVLESMKMETVLRAPFPALVRECLVSVGSQVGTGAPLLRLEPRGDGQSTESTGSGQFELDLPAAPDGFSAEQKVQQGSADLRSLLLGFAVAPSAGGRTPAECPAARAALPRRPLAAELGLLEVFADLSERSRTRPVGEEHSSETRVHSPREYFHTSLQSLDAERAGLSETFRGR